MRYLPLKSLLLCTALAPTASAAATFHELHPGDGQGTHNYARGGQEVRVPKEDLENLQSAYLRVMSHASPASPKTSSGDRPAASTVTTVHADQGERAVASISTLKLESEAVGDMVAVADRIKTACATGRLIALDFSGYNLHNEWVESFVAILTRDDMRMYHPQITRINFMNNWIDGLGLQYLIPLLRLSTLEIMDVSNNGVDSEQIENFGSVDAYDQYTPASEHILLSADERDALLSKVIWIPRSFFGATADKNPTGSSVTPEVILRHRKYFGLPY